MISLRFVWTSAKKDWVRRLRDPLVFLLWIGIPVVIGGLLSLVSGGGGDIRPRGKMLVVDEDDTFLSGALASLFRQGPLGELFDVDDTTREAGLAAMDGGDAAALLIIPAGLTDALLEDEPLELELVKNPAQQIVPRIAEETLSMLVDAVFYVQRIAGDTLRDDLREFAAGPPGGASVFPNATVAEFSARINSMVEGLSDDLFPPIIEVEVEEAPVESGPPVSFGRVFFAGLLFMTLFFMAQGLSDDIWRERVQGTLRRAATSPQSLAALLWGKLVSAGGLVALVGGLALVLGSLAFDFPLARAPLALVWVVVCGVALTALMICVQLLARSQRAGSLLTNTLLFPLLMLGGAFFPFEAMPEWMAALGRLTPNGWALERLKTILYGDPGPAAAALGFGAVLVFTALLAGFGQARMRVFARS